MISTLFLCLKEIHIYYFFLSNIDVSKNYAAFLSLKKIIKYHFFTSVKILFFKNLKYLPPYK